MSEEWHLFVLAGVIALVHVRQLVAADGGSRFAGGTHTLDGVTGMGTGGFNRVSGGAVLFDGAASRAAATASRTEDGFGHVVPA